MNSPLPSQNSPTETQIQSQSTQFLPGWRLWLPLILQTALIITVPAQDAYTYLTGRRVILQTAPVDPYDLMRGYSQTLSYDISNPRTLESLPGGKGLFPDNYQLNRNYSFYVTLEAPVTSNSRSPQAWKPVRVSRDHPTNLATNQIALKGYYQDWQIIYGLETYYMPEDQRDRINQEINQVEREQRQAFVVEVKIDGQGNAVPVSLWISDHQYRF